MTHLSRRQLFRGAGAVAAAAAISACSTAPGKKSSKSLTWWDHFQPLSDLEKELFAAFTKETGTAVDYTVYNPEQMGRSLQLAWSSKQMPDVFTLAGVAVPPPRLVKDGWFAPLELDAAAAKLVPEATKLEGLNVFEGKLYSLSQFSFRQYTTLNWFNRELFEKAGLDPEAPPATYDEVRAAGRAVKKKGGDNVSGVVLPLQFKDRLREHVLDLAQAAGAPITYPPFSSDATDIKTGAYAFHSEQFLTAFEFLLSLKKDGLVFPASSSLDARKARARWSTGIAGMFLDGPWNIGVVVDEFKPFTDKVAVGPVPLPEAGTPVLTAQPRTGEFWVAGTSKQVKAASELLGRILEPEYQAKLAENMDQVPMDIEAAGKADLHATYRAALDIYQEQVFLAPSPTVKNPAVAEVRGQMKEITPNLGEIVQGAFAGKISNVKSALQELSDKYEAEREKAIKAVTDKGGKVSLDDWKFPNWEPGKDYGPESYQ